ncbi:hypothetical protein ACJZ2D_004670 [Fusarium nematophilum]
MARKKNKSKAGTNPKKRNEPPRDPQAPPPRLTTVASSRATDDTKRARPRQRGKMARRRKTSKATASPAIERESFIEPYGAVQARARLEAEGFHPDVTDKSPDEELKSWAIKASLDLKRPTRAQFIQGHRPKFLGTYADPRPLLRHMDLKTFLPENLPSRLLGVFAGWQTYGERMGEILAMQGLRQLETVAVAYPRGWAALATSMTRWDTVAGGVRGTPHGTVLLFLSPKYTRSDFETDHNLGSKIAQENMAAKNVSEAITEIHDECGPTAPYWGRREAKRAKGLFPNYLAAYHAKQYGRELVRSVRSLPHIEDLQGMMEGIVEPRDPDGQHTSNQVAIDDTITMLNTIYVRQRKIRVLHFHRSAFLDRRLLAVILRGCPQVKMLGVYECPLLHVGDVLCLLDVINEVNRGRSKNQPQITAFDFYPRYHAGTPHTEDEDHKHCATYGLTWKPARNDIVQRGLLCIVMQAALKARHMKINVLMDRHGAFMAYLLNLPMPPLKVQSFLDGLYRYLDLKSSKSKNKNALKQATYDIVKAVRMGIEKVDRDWPTYYCEYMGRTMLFCSSCGYEMLEDFFSAMARDMRPRRRVCTACTLRKGLDEENDHGKEDAKDIVGALFEDWDAYDFNDDAQPHVHGQGLLRLKTRETVRPPAPTMQIGPDGTFYQPQYEQPLVRDNKSHHDSVQNLPTLDELVSAEFQGKRNEARRLALVYDMQRAVSHLLYAFYPEAKGGLDAFPGYVNENQGERRPIAETLKLSNNFASATFVDSVFRKKGY